VFAELYRQRRELELHKSNLEALVEQKTLELQRRNEELQATEEMLRVQIGEYEVAQHFLRQANRRPKPPTSPRAVFWPT